MPFHGSVLPKIINAVTGGAGGKAVVANPEGTNPFNPNPSGGSNLIPEEFKTLISDVSGIFLNRDPETGAPRGIAQESLSLEQQGRFTAPVERRATQLGETADFLSRFGRGETTDPRFEALRRRRLGTASEFLTRRGIGSSSAAINQLGRVGEQLDIEESGARERALLQSSVFAGQEAGLRSNIQNVLSQGISSRNLAEQNRLGSITAGVETASLPIQLLISAIAAEKAGEQADSGGGGGLGGILGSILGAFGV